ncbi:MAG: hypothetical protein N3A71_03155 [Candidatus Dojkabacteria bacterium]|nr:hypothetical protein [Candidatus Dojkabacteria bacterium]
MKSLSLFSNNLKKTSDIDTKPDSSLSKFLHDKLEKLELKKNKKKVKLNKNQILASFLAKELDAKDNIGLLNRITVSLDHMIIMRALTYVKDYPDVKSKLAVFIWFLKNKMNASLNQNSKTIKQIRLFGKISKKSKKGSKKDIKNNQSN